MNSLPRKNSNKIRDLYRQKGILNEEALRPEILKSWERSKIFQSASSNFGILERPDKNPPSLNADVQCFFDAIMDLHPSICGIYLVHQDGRIHSFYTLDSIFSGLKSWSERTIGTTSFSLLMEYGDVFLVNQGENFLPIFDDFATLAIPVSAKYISKNELITVVMILENAMEVEKIMSFIAEKREMLGDIVYSTKANRTSIKLEMSTEIALAKPKYSEFSNYNTHLLEGISREIVEFKNEILHLNSKHLCFRIYAETANEGISAVSYLIRNTKNINNENCFVSMVSEEKVYNQIWNFNQEKLSFNVLIIVGLHKLTYGQQRQIYRAIQDKGKETSSTVGLNSMDHRIYLVETLKDENPEKPKLILDELKILQNSPKIILPPINRRRQDIAMVVKSLESQLSENETHSKKSTDHSFIKHPEIMGWQGSADELSRWVIFNHGQRQQLSIWEDGLTEVFSAVEDAGISTKSVAEQTVEDLRTDEKTHILKALKVYNYNINKAAKALGIARATLYRKIERYDLEIERQKKI